jgi:hypothetical protein
VVDSILGSAGKQADGLECKAHLLFNILRIEAEGGFGGFGACTSLPFSVKCRELIKLVALLLDGMEELGRRRLGSLASKSCLRR